MTHQIESNPLDQMIQVLDEHGFDGMARAIEILVNEAMKIERNEVPGMDLTENLPKLAQVTDKLTLVRSMSYTPVGLFNYTAAIYQIHTGYTACVAGAGIKRGAIHGESDATASASISKPLHPIEMLATIYQAIVNLTKMSRRTGEKCSASTALPISPGPYSSFPLRS